MTEPQPLVSTPAQRVLGCRLYNQLGLCASSYRDWFAEGRPHEWLAALAAIQKTLGDLKRQAQQAAREDREAPHEVLPLFAGREEDGP